MSTKISRLGIEKGLEGKKLREGVKKPLREKGIKSREMKKKITRDLGGKTEGQRGKVYKEWEMKKPGVDALEKIFTGDKKEDPGQMSLHEKKALEKKELAETRKRIAIRRFQEMREAEERITSKRKFAGGTAEITRGFGDRPAEGEDAQEDTGFAKSDPSPGSSFAKGSDVDDDGELVGQTPSGVGPGAPPPGLGGGGLLP